MTKPTDDTAPIITTVGYSIHEWKTFLALLKGAEITAIADVRSHPTARLEQYRQEHLAPALQREGIEYVFLGDELGARRNEPECYVNDRVDYQLVPQTPAFQAGIQRLAQGVKRFRIALMCAEREPLDCHRGLMITRYLADHGWNVSHLMPDGTMETHAQTEQRLIAMVGIDPLFDGELAHETLIARAYAERSRDRTHVRETFDE